MGGVGDLVVRAARLPDEAVVLAEVFLSSARHHAGLRPDLYRVPDRGAVVERCRQPLPDGQVMLVAELDGQVVGCAEVHLHTSDNPASMMRPATVATVELAVLDGRRGNGLGSALMAAAEEAARAGGADRIHLDMLADNEGALRFYRDRFGYATHGLLMGKPLT